MAPFLNKGESEAELREGGEQSGGGRNASGRPFAEGQTLFVDFLTRLSEGGTNESHPLNLVVIEWLRMQDPSATFAQFNYTQLLGQEYPGLGCGQKFHQLLTQMAKKSQRDGLMNSPAYFHNAILYHKLDYQFGNPQIEGAFRILLRDMQPYKASWYSCCFFCFLSWEAQGLIFSD